MWRQRVWLGSSVGWLLTCFIATRVESPIGLSPWVFALQGLILLALVLEPRLSSLRTLGVAVVALGVFAAGKLLATGTLLVIASIESMVELSALAVSVFLSVGLARNHAEFQEVLSRAISADPAVSYGDGQDLVYREVRRARRFERPLSVLAISVGEVLEDSRDRVLEELCRANVRRFATAKVSALVGQNVKEADLLLQRRDHLITVLPETHRADAVRVARRLSELSEKRLGLELDVGISSFPDEEVTLSGLLDRAEAGLRTSNHADFAPESSHADEVGSPSAFGETGSAGIH